MLENRKFLKITAQQMYEEEFKKPHFDLIEVQVDKYLTLDNTIKSIFRYCKE